MSDLARLCGGVVVTGFPGSSATPELLEGLHDLAPAGVVLFDRNVSSPDDTRAAIAAVRAAVGGAAPALVCVDQEGGRVARLRFRDPGIPAMLGLGAADDADLATRTGAALADDLRLVGANVDFAPVLDLAVDAGSTVIGTRSFGDDPARTARLGAALIRGMQGRGIAATAKHFPGHGATALDSHRELPGVDASLAVLRARELVPFAAAIAAGVRAVMTAHVVVRAFDAESPATLSRRVTTDLLRGELGFAGVCFTDCLQMDAIASGVGSVCGGVLALAAGADALLVSHDLALARELRDALVRAVETGDVPLARVEQAARRIGALRAWLATEPDAFRSGDADVDDIALDVARRAVALVRGRPHLAAGKPVTVVSFEGDASDGIARSSAERPSLSLALRRRRVRSESMRVPLDPSVETVAMLLDVLRAQGDRALVILARRAHLHPLQCGAIATLLDLAPSAIVVSMLEPFDVPSLERASILACTFGDEAANVEALADVLARGASAPGAFPIALASGNARLLTEGEIDRRLPHRDAPPAPAAEPAADDAEAGGA